MCPTFFCSLSQCFLLLLLVLVEGEECLPGLLDLGRVRGRHGQVVVHREVVVEVHELLLGGRHLGGVGGCRGHETLGHPLAIVEGKELLAAVNSRCVKFELGELLE